MPTKRQIQKAIALMRSRADTLEEWQDADRTITCVELSKWCPGWNDF